MVEYIFINFIEVKKSKKCVFVALIFFYVYVFTYGKNNNCQTNYISDKCK